MTHHFRVSELDCLEIAGRQHSLVSLNRTGSIWSRLDDPSVCISLTGDELIRLLAAPDTRLRRSFFSSKSAYRRLRHDHNYLQSVEPEKRSKALWQSTCVQVFLEAEARRETTRTERSIDALRCELERRVNLIEEVDQDLGRKPRAGQVLVRRRFPSARWLLEWVRLAEKGGHSPLVFLRKKSGKVPNKRLAADAEGLLAECVLGYLDRNEPTQEQIVSHVKDRFTDANAARVLIGQPALSVPSASTVRRRIRGLDPFEVMAQRKGIDAARRKFGFFENGIPADYPMQRLEMDEWQIDLVSLLGESGALDCLPPEERARFAVGRRWLYVAVDCATRCILGFRLVSTPNADDAIRMLNLIIQDKTPIAVAAGCESSWGQSGGIGQLFTDQGSAFVAEKFRVAVADLGATYEAPPAGVPKLRARIERLFRTFGQQLAPMLIGRTFSDPVARGDYPSEKWAALTDDELAKVFTLFVVDIYHNTPHSGLMGETPANAWKRLEAEQGVTPPPDANQRRAVLGIPHSRRLGRHGVRVFGINYTCPQLQTALLRGAGGEVDLRIDPEDLTHISVCLGQEWFSAEAVSGAVHGLSFDEWLVLVRVLRERFKEEALLSEHVVREARKKIRAIDAEARQLRRVQPPHLTADMLQQEERRLFLGLRIGPEASSATGAPEHPHNRGRPGPDDLFGDVVEPAGPITPKDGGETAEPDVTSDDEEWTFDD
ncbi:Mu transposase C-terminal domain-containing protein [Ruegeria sp. 2012CJ41-6]|uniref:Mu transposase C-terminal domain-containing protein n=1 Tax=Ruegeria spongiae TaxID=2942209 RepID=A0ABT0QA10_9RHOB|nr:Mu transposase C-terminal domain-containing protein [Ruegeria spongiae]MCL6285739.1 Mu transposase C-terminal domain-containing protein [Ruegeria spongiae]